MNSKIINKKKINNKGINNKTKKNISESKLDINFKEYLNPLDDTCYRESLQHDKRKFCESFFDSLKDNQLFFDTFFNQEDIKPTSIKIIFFILTITFYFVINGFFYDESFITELYHSNDESFFAFLNDSFGRFVSVSIIVQVITFIIDFLFCDEDEIKVILTESKNIKSEINHFVSKLTRRHIIFISITFVISCFCWLYVSCFNNVYPNTKYDWIKSSVFLISIIEIGSILTVFLQTLLRYIGLKKKSKQLFEFSQVLG